MSTNKTTIDIYAKVKYNKRKELICVINKALNHTTSDIVCEDTAVDKNGVKI